MTDAIPPRMNDRSPLVFPTADQDKSNAECAAEIHRWDTDFMNAAVRGLATIQTGQRERLARRAALTYLPRGLKWLVDRPRLLRVVYKLRPSWRPTIYVGVDGDFTAFCVRGKHGIIYCEGSTARVDDAR